MIVSEKKFRQLPIIMTSMSRWDGDVSSASLSLAKVFSRTNPVYYIDYPFSYADLAREYNTAAVKRRLPALLSGKGFLNQIDGQPANMYSATPRLVLPTYSLPQGNLRNTCSRYNDGVMTRLVQRILKQEGIEHYIFINSFNPSYLSNLDPYLQPVLSVYQSRDAIEAVNQTWVENENVCVRSYNLAIATSRQLCRNISERTQQPVSYFPNGGDAHLFRSAMEQNLPKPPELASIKTPIIGYTGAVCQRMDYQLLIKIAKENRDKTIVLVGPRKDQEFCPVDLNAVPNIVFTGPKKITELPSYLRYFDCAIIPFKYDTFTRGIYPLKINEYLSAGKPVVTTNFSEDIASFSEQVYLADTHDDFLRLLPKALADNSRPKQEARLAVAMANSWENRVAAFWELAWNAYRSKSSAVKHMKVSVS